MNSSGTATPNINRLRNIARQVFEDDNAIKLDESLAQIETRILYAIDFSEIFSYVFMDKLSYLGGERSREFVLNVGFNEMVLHELLLSGRYSIFMLPSHRIEFGQLFDTMHERELSELGQVFSALRGKLTLRKKLLSALDKFDAASNSGSPDNALAVQIVNEASRDAPNILLLARVASARSRQRLQHFLARNTLIPLEDLLKRQADFQLDRSIVSEALDEFTKRRQFTRESTNRVDAYALSYLTALINNLPPKTAFRFVSRSQTFEDVSVALARRGIIPNEVVASLRHPRVFSAYVLARSTERSLAEFIHQRISAAGTFLSALGDLDGHAQSNLPTFPTAAIGHSADALTATVRDIERIAMLSSVSEMEKPHSANKSAPFHTDVTRLVTLLRNHDEVRQAVHSRAQEVVDRLSAGTIALAGSIAVSSVTDHSSTELEADVQPRSVRRSEGAATAVTVVPIGSSPVTYSLSFYATFVSRKLEKGEAAYSVLSQFVSSADLDSPFERRLATAYLLGLNQDWELSLRFANAALDDQLAADSTPRHEGYYYRAVARRHALMWDIENITASLKDVMRAQEISSAVHVSKEDEDPRYLNERAIVINQGLRAGLSEGALAALGVHGDPVELWRRVLKGNASVMYKLNAWNNITFFYVQAKDKAKAKESLEALTAFADENQFQTTALPLGVQDTIFSARLLTNFYSDPKEIAFARSELDRIRQDSYVQKEPIRRKSG